MADAGKGCPSSRGHGDAHPQGMGWHSSGSPVGNRVAMRREGRGAMCFFRKLARK